MQGRTPRLVRSHSWTLRRRFARSRLADDVHVAPSVRLPNAEDPPVVAEICTGE